MYYAIKNKCMYFVYTSSNVVYTEVFIDFTVIVIREMHKNVHFEAS